MIKEGDTVQLKGKKSSFFVKIEKDKVFSTHKGNIDLNQLIGKEYGSIIKSHLGEEFIVLKPSLFDIIMYGIKRQTQIIYPKDSAFITLKLGITDGMKVLESGVGSAALTIVMANAVKPAGKIIAYEKEEKYIDQAYKNLKLANLEKYVEIKHHDLSSEILEKDFDAAFIDVREPWLYLDNIKKALKVGANIGFLVPTTNQIINLLTELHKHNFINIEVIELLERHYKPVPDRLRPTDRMVAHTGYLIFAKKGLESQ